MVKPNETVLSISMHGFSNGFSTKVKSHSYNSLMLGGGVGWGGY